MSRWARSLKSAVRSPSLGSAIALLYLLRFHAESVFLSEPNVLSVQQVEPERGSSTQSDGSVSGWSVTSRLRAGVSCALARFFYLSVGYPLFYCITVKPVIGANLKSRNLTLAKQFVDRALMNSQILCYFGSRHDFHVSTF